MKVDFTAIQARYDVLIVGMGTAGLMAAKSLPDSLSILIVDYRKMPRHKACSGIIVKQGHDIFHQLNPPEHVYRYPKFLDITYLDWDNKKENKTKKNFLNTDRFSFDKWLYETVSKRPNVYVCDGTRLADFSITSNGSITSNIKCDQSLRSVSSKYLIGADGANSLVRSKISNRKIPFYVAIQETFPAKKKLDTAYFIFDKEITDYYSWVIPKSDNVEIGVALSSNNVEERFKFFKQKIKDKLGISGSGHIESAIILRPRNRNDICLGKGNILLVGEAAGLITPSGAEGISNALRSGVAAAAAIKNRSKSKVIGAYRSNCSILLNRFSKKFKKALILKDSSRRFESFYSGTDDIVHSNKHSHSIASDSFFASADPRS